ncbi:hypothetical protein FBR02_17655 [Anaerolineae bacterium CFX9]|jgi:hypothetical protein|nr:hypothetical protein [Kamptonema cortianum]MDL1902580.1 hypothetical protein [Anaerolineae bacterium CFX9]
MRRLDQSSHLSRLLERLSSLLARQRGLLTVLGLFLIIISFVIHLVSLNAPSTALTTLWSITHHAGLILAIIGLLLVQPLGR